MRLADIDTHRLTWESAEIDFRTDGVVLTGTSCLIDADVITVEVTGDDKWAGTYDVHVSKIEKITYGADL